MANLRLAQGPDTYLSGRTVTASVGKQKCYQRGEKEKYPEMNPIGSRSGPAVAASALIAREFAYVGVLSHVH